MHELNDHACHTFIEPPFSSKNAADIVASPTDSDNEDSKLSIEGRDELFERFMKSFK